MSKYRKVVWPRGSPGLAAARFVRSAAWYCLNATIPCVWSGTPWIRAGRRNESCGLRNNGISRPFLLYSRCRAPCISLSPPGVDASNSSPSAGLPDFSVACLPAVLYGWRCLKSWIQDYGRSAYGKYLLSSTDVPPIWRSVGYALLNGCVSGYCAR